MQYGLYTAFVALIATGTVPTIGPITTGLFSIGLPGVGWSEIGALVAGALSVVFVGYSESLASARAMASSITTRSTRTRS